MSSSDPAPGAAVSGKVVTNEGTLNRRHLNPKLIIGGILFVALIAGGWFLAAFIQNSMACSRTLAMKALTLEQAQAQLQCARTSQDKVTAYSNEAQLYLARQQYDKSITAFQNGLTSAPDSMPLLTGLVAAYQASGQNAKAIPTIQKIISVLQQSSNKEDKALAARYQGLLDSLKGMSS